MRSNSDKSRQNLKKGNSGLAKSSAQNMGDKDSQRLAKISSKMGNADLKHELSKNTAERDRLLAFICKRLEIMKGVQQIEHSELKHERKWFREVAKGETGFHTPDPKRWHEPAKAFEKAAEALCKGHIGKGIEALEKAIKIESKTYDETPKMVKEKLRNEQKKTEKGVIAQNEALAFSAICPEIHLPQMMNLVDEIINLSDSTLSPPPMPMAWWWSKEGVEEDEDEDEEEDT